jgi:hypothetical protein
VPVLSIMPLSSIFGRLPMTGHGIGPGGSGMVHVLLRRGTRVWMTRYTSITMSSNSWRIVERRWARRRLQATGRQQPPPS